MSIEDIKPDVEAWARIQDHYTPKAKKDLPKISIVIPTYNQAHLLERSLQSCIEQIGVEKELLIVDAGSFDYTAELLERYKEHIDRVYYVTRFNLPLMISKGFSIATGEYVAFLLPGTQYLNVSALSHISHVAFDNLKPDLVFSGTYLTQSSFKKFSQAISKTFEEIDPNFSCFPYNKNWLKRGYYPTSPSSTWFKVSMLQTKGGLNYEYTSYKKSIFDFLCKLYKDNNIKVAMTFWATTTYDMRTGRGNLNLKEFFNFWHIIFKQFGVLSAIAWPFSNKPFRIAKSFTTRLISFFREN